jgi:Fic-DOC domain mobile mystery protein B
MSPDLQGDADDGTPLSPEEREGLIPSHITLRNELNELEQQNIIKATVWAFSRGHNPVSESFIRSLHRRMFHDVWLWAGKYRQSNKNIGADYRGIVPQLYEMLDNTRYWVEHNTYPADEIGVRFHHGLVAIHPFPNGNGRWSRLMADILVVRLGRTPFTWGSQSLVDEGETRRAYINALRAADDNNFANLLHFSRS